MSTDLALWCEHEVARIMAEQERHGVNFRSQRASWLVHKITEEILALDREAIPQLPMMLNTAPEYKKPFLKSGKLAKFPKLYCESHGLDSSSIAGPFSRVWYTEFDMGKTDKVKRLLVDYGWKPDEFNTKKLRDLSDEDKQEYINGYVTKNFIEEKSPHWKSMLLRELRYKGKRNRVSITNFLINQQFLPTSPKLTESSLSSVSGTVGRLVMSRVQLSHRRSLLQGLLKQVRKDGKLGASANPCATPTFRMKHRVVVNIPAARSVYGSEIRSLFIGDTCRHSHKRLHLNNKLDDECRLVPYTNLVEKLDEDTNEWKLGGTHNVYVSAGQRDFVGYDASGLELRMLAHFLNDPDYTHQILEGDIHAYNQYLAGLPTRDDAKTFIYAFIYGGGDAKLGEIVGGSRNDGAALRAKFLSELPALGDLINRTRSEAERGYLVGLDGRRLTMRKGYDGKPQLHKALNTRLQGAGAVVMKYSMITLDRWVKQARLDAHKVIDMHDEGQWSSNPTDTPQLRLYMDNCCRVAGEYLNLNIPLASESQVGASWYDTH